MADIPGDTSTTASISVGGTVSGNLENAGDHDWFRVTLVAGQTYTISVTGTGPGGLPDSYLNIFDATGTTILAFDDDIVDGTNRNSLINFTAPTSGTFYLDVGSFHDQYAGTYQLSVQPYVPPPIATNDQIADQLVNGFWGGDAHHFNVTQGGTITVNISTLNPAEQTLARAALAEWSDIIGVSFREVTSGAQIDFDDTEDPRNPNTPVASTDADWVDGIITHAHVHISTSWVTRYHTGLNTYSFQTYIHEIGHALGLGHAGNYNGDATYPNDALFQNDAWSTSIMSYFDQRENTYFASQGFSRDFALTPMGADILAMQSLYGLSTTTRTGNTTYGFNSNAGGIYDASLYGTAAYTIFDSGGTDTLDFSGSFAAQLINLNPETFSNVAGQTGNLSIARGVVIENAIGGGAGDTLIGNSADNVLTGNGGSDTLTGGAGNDIFKDTKAGLSGDTIVDFSPGDKILFTDASFSGFTFSLSGHTVSYTGGSLTLTNVPAGTIVASAVSGGGVQLSIGSATNQIPQPAHNDFNGDGLSDILWRNDNGTVTDWIAKAGGFSVNSANFQVVATSNWQIAATGDFNGDGRVDILWRATDGTVTDWLGQINGSFSNNFANFSINASSNWHIIGTGDFNRDGLTDILWRSDSGTLTNWLGQANGSFFNNWVNFTIQADSSWHVIETGDFNGDGYSDLLWRSDGGTVTDWLGQAGGGFFNNWANFTVNADASWHVIGTGDFNGDGIDDLLWRSDGGTVTDWLGQPNGGFAPNSANFTIQASSSWHIVGTGDFNGDHRDDILWQSDGGQFSDWLGQTDGALVSSAQSYFANVDTHWHVQPVETFL